MLCSKGRNITLPVPLPPPRCINLMLEGEGGGGSNPLMDQHLIFGGRRNDPNHLMLWKLE